MMLPSDLRLFQNFSFSGHPVIKHRPVDGTQNPIRALVVEDDMLIMLDIEEILKSIGITHVSCATNIESATKLVETVKPDFALMDYRVGKATTAELAVTLQALKVPFAFVTASIPPEGMLPKLVTQSLIMKPFSEVDIRSAVELLLQQGGNQSTT